MTKKALNERSSYHKYGRSRDNSVIALFFDWNSDDSKGKIGYKYCVFARASMATKKDLQNAMYNIVVLDQDIPEYYINCKIAQDDTQRFKVPISWSGSF